MTRLLGRLFMIEDLSSIHGWEITLGAPWAQRYPVLLMFGIVAIAAAGIVYYVRYQHIGRHFGRDLMALFRAAVLLLLLLILAEPMISLTVTEHPRPLVLALFDGSGSMGIRDVLPDETAKQLTDAMDPEDRPEALDERNRLNLVQHVLAGPAKGALGELAKRNRVRAYIMDRADYVREIDVSGPGGKDGIDVAHLAGQLTAEGPVTALGSALDDLNRRHKGPLLAGVVIFSDFDRNAGRDPVAAARELGAPLFTVGVGPHEVVDLAVDLQAPLVLKRDEKATVTVLLRQTGLTGRSAQVSLTARKQGMTSGLDVQGAAVAVSPVQVVPLKDAQVACQIPFLPTVSGRYVLEAKVEAYPDEVLEENNVADREVTVRDESLKLYFVEYEPTWEWRFVKEVFHRDPLIGRTGFRTFLRSADFKVRRDNELFTETLVRPRSEFFANDVILLSDVPGEMLSQRFQEMLEEYVKQFGGGLVVIAGAQYGIGELRDTRIAEMLPVIVDPASKPEIKDFRLQLTPAAADADFMNLGRDEHENRVAWANLGRLPWFQPVLRPHPLATVLASHPSERCADDRRRQPIIATMPCGKGEVVYIGFNEMWRLRRKYGEKYYRRFWGQLIYRLGLSRALGSQKRFDVGVERPIYQSGDQVRVTVEAYDLNFEPLDVPKLSARLVAVDQPDGDAPAETSLPIPLARGEFVYETTFPVYTSGRHRLLVRDPATGDEIEAGFKVASVSIERRSAARDYELQKNLAAQTGGRHCELHAVAGVLGDIPAVRVNETSEHRLALWNTWVVLILVIALMLAEWLTRKLMNLR